MDCHLREGKREKERDCREGRIFGKVKAKTRAVIFQNGSKKKNFCFSEVEKIDEKTEKEKNNGD